MSNINPLRIEKEVTRLILKEKTEPESLNRLRRLVTRLEDPSPYLQELRNREQGYHYECQLQFFLDRILYQFHPTIILHDIRIPIGHTSFQIDCLLLTMNFGLLIEIKSSSGTMSFTNNGRFFNYDKGEMHNPITQVLEQRDRLIDFLGVNNYFFEHVVCVGNPRVSVETDDSSNWVLERIIPFEQLKNFINNMFQKYSQSIITKDRMINIGNYLKSSHQEKLHRYNVHPNLVQPGVICPSCKRLGMERKRYNWYCKHCKCDSKYAHHEDILDWFSFKSSDKLTNTTCRNFLGVNSETTAYTLLNNCNLILPIGKNRGRYYILKE